jgi:hypothetical protein
MNRSPCRRFAGESLPRREGLPASWVALGWPWVALCLQGLVVSGALGGVRPLSASCSHVRCWRWHQLHVTRVGHRCACRLRCAFIRKSTNAPLSVGRSIRSSAGIAAHAYRRMPAVQSGARTLHSGIGGAHGGHAFYLVCSSAAAAAAGKPNHAEKSFVRHPSASLSMHTPAV